MESMSGVSIRKRDMKSRSGERKKIESNKDWLGATCTLLKS
jgi:hypothetical protein